MEPIFNEQVEHVQAESPDKRRERVVRQGMLSEQLLHRQNLYFDGTGGVSENNRELGFVPAFMDADSGESVVSRFADGRPAPIHVLDGLPEEWITARDENGSVLSARDGVIAGFISHGRFYTRDEAEAATAGQMPDD